MQELIEQLYYVVHNPLVTPAQLVNNAKLPEYQRISFEKHEDGLAATMEYLWEGNAVEFKYYFDAQDHLQKAILIDLKANTVEVIFDRTVEINELESRFVSNRSAKQSIAI